MKQQLPTTLQAEVRPHSKPAYYFPKGLVVLIILVVLGSCEAPTSDNTEKNNSAFPEVVVSGARWQYVAQAEQDIAVSMTLSNVGTADDTLKKAWVQRATGEPADLRKVVGSPGDSTQSKDSEEAGEIALAAGEAVVMTYPELYFSLSSRDVQVAPGVGLQVFLELEKSGTLSVDATYLDPNAPITQPEPGE